MKITLVTACRNAAKTLGMTLASARRQKLGSVELECIVVDAASTDGTREVIREFADRLAAEDDTHGNFSVRWISEPDCGLYDGINKGIRMATGDVVGICNADDILADDETIACIAHAFDDEDVDATYADIRFVRKGESVDEMRRAPTARYCTGRFFKNWQFRFATFPAHPSIFIRKVCFEKYGYYSLDYSICSDFELMLRLFYKNKIRARYLPICTHVMRMGGVSTKNAEANFQINREDLRALRENGVWSCLPLIYLKYFAKIWGFVFRRRATVSLQ